MNQRMRKVYKEVAKKYGVTPEEVEREIRACIEEMYASPQAPETRAVQARIPRRGVIPTNEEMISFIAAEIRKDE